MFWNFHFNSSGIDTLLSKEDVTLQDVLDDENILQECKTQNNKLIEFLAEDDNLRQLLHLVVDEPQADAVECAKYKYKNIACEILTIDIFPILDKIANNEDYLDIIWEFIDSSPPLNPLIASFFSKVISILILRKGQETFRYLKNRDGVNKLMAHIGTSAIMELFVKMVTVVENQDQRLSIAQWLNEENLIEKCIDLLVSTGQEENHYNISQLLSELIRIGRDSISQCSETEDPLLLTFEKKETVEKLLDAMFTDSSGSNADSSVLAGITILSSLMEIKRPVIEGMEEFITQIDLERIANGIHSTLESLSGRMKCFYEALQPPTTIVVMETTFGTLEPPLGKVRLNIAGLICTAVSTNTKIINDALSQTEILSTLLDLFATYEWNNFLHTYVQNSILAVLNTEAECPTQDKDSEASTNRPLDPLLRKLFNECNLVKRCIDMWKENQVSQGNGTHGRKGYMGHLTKIMNEIIIAKENGPNRDHIMSLFNELPDNTREEWSDIVLNSLAETNQKNITVPMGSNLFLDDSSESDGEVYLIEAGKPIPIKRLNISQYDGSLQQAFENYQVQPMTNEFIDSFGYDEAKVDESENLRNTFDEVGSIDFSINANEESENEKLFESICEQKIKPFADSDEDDEEDLWEEKQLTFTSGAEPRLSTNSIPSDSDSSGDDEGKSSSVFDSDDNSKDDDKMEVDNENRSKGWWTADFSNIDVLSNSSNDTSNWASSTAVDKDKSLLSSSGEAFADFTDIAKFSISNEAENANLPIDMETEGSAKHSDSSVYEVRMDEDHTDQNHAKLNNAGKENTSSKLTQITVRSVRSPSPGLISLEKRNEEKSTSQQNYELTLEEGPNSEIQHEEENETIPDDSINKEYEHIEISSTDSQIPHSKEFQSPANVASNVKISEQHSNSLT